MGISIGHNWSASSYDKPQVVYVDKPSFPNPNPKNFHINATISLGRLLLVDITYPDCTNYEGRKLLLFRDTTLEQLMRQGSIDPHFSDNPKFHSPIARFEPSVGGRELAQNFMVFLHGG